MLQDPGCDAATLSEAFNGEPHVTGQVETVAQDLIKQVPVLRAKVAKLCQAGPQICQRCL